MSASPEFASTPRCSAVSIGTANTNRDGTGTIGTVFTAGANGSRVDYVEIVAVGTTTAGVVRLYIYDGSNYFLLREVLVSALTPSTTVAVFSAIIALDRVLPSGYSLRASTHNAETFKVTGFGGDF